MQRAVVPVVALIAVIALAAVFGLRGPSQTQPAPAPDKAPATSAPAPEGTMRPFVPPAKPAPGTKAAGKLPLRAVHDELRRLEPTLRGCYDAELADDPALAGRWSITFDVAPDGTTGTVVVQGAPSVERMHGCIRDEVREWTFPESELGTKVVHSVRFEPS